MGLWGCGAGLASGYLRCCLPVQRSTGSPDSLLPSVALPHPLSPSQIQWIPEIGLVSASLDATIKVRARGSQEDGSLRQEYAVYSVRSDALRRLSGAPTPAVAQEQGSSTVQSSVHVRAWAGYL